MTVSVSQLREKRCWFERHQSVKSLSFFYEKLLDTIDKLCYNCIVEVRDMLFIKKIKGMRGCVPDSWWIFDENEKCIATFLTLEEAEEFFNINCKENDK